MKNWIKPGRVEWISFFAMMPVLTILLNMLLFPDRVWKDSRIWAFSFPVIYVQGFISWYLHIVSMHWLRIRFPLLRQTSFRLTVLYITHIFLTSLTFFSLFYGYDLFNFLGYQFNVGNFKLSLLVSLALTLVATTMWEAEYIFGQWKKSLAEKETMQQLAIQHEFETLKSQVNPHFLFNCFNTLSSLISEDAKQAEKFLNELSKVYRYLLRNNEDGLTTVKSEIQFIRSYFQLLKTRHGNAIDFNIEIDKRYDNYLLPSLSLQLLVENAVKHNVLSKNFPLTIEIFTAAGNKLVVNNNLQRRSQKPPSNKVGLENIQAKYDLLRQSGFQVLEDSKNFTVVLPLLWNNSTEARSQRSAITDFSTKP
ncbi:MAG: histidine kinase [Gemmatimonadaceae bacterium]|nr:histidine kinase [Chitinophagaceae bacterium]